MIQLTRTLAREWADRGVRVNAVCPGCIETDLTAKMHASQTIRASILEQTPMRRLAEMHEVVAPALFLASDDTSYATRAASLVDGGSPHDQRSGRYRGRRQPGVVPARCRLGSASAASTTPASPVLATNRQHLEVPSSCAGITRARGLRSRRQRSAGKCM